MRLTDVASTEQLLRIIRSIPSPKAEPFKRWLAQVGRERIEKTIDPEQAIDRALDTYQKKGYDADWIHQRILSIRVRNELTAEWRARGVEQGREYAILTDEITKAWSGMTTRQYKNLKGLKHDKELPIIGNIQQHFNCLVRNTIIQGNGDPTLLAHVVCGKASIFPNQRPDQNWVALEVDHIQNVRAL